MQSKKKRGSSFGKILSRDGNIAGNPLPEENLSVYIYRSLETLPLDRFIVCVCDGDLSALIIKPDPDQEIPALLLLEAWNDIFLDYLDASRDNTSRYRQNMETKVAIYSAQLDQIGVCLMGLQVVIRPEFVEPLQRMEVTDYDCAALDQLFQTSKKDYFAELNLIKSRSVEKKIDKELLEIELVELAKSEEMQEKKRADRLTFVNILSRISTYKNVAVIHSSQLSTLEFCAMFNEYLDHINALKAANQRRKP